MNELLSLNGVTISFGERRVVKDAVLSLHAGEMLALVGESGSGKSLTALSIPGLLPAGAQVSGSVTFEGHELIGAGEAALRTVRGARIGMVFQEPMSALNPLHTIGRQIGEMLTLHQNLRAFALAERIRGLLADVGLEKLANRLDAYPHQLSGGERQRVMIAMAIANNPSLLIADEPTTAVDVTVQVHILHTLKRLQRERNMGILFITHDLTLVSRMAERVAVMKEGVIVEAGPVAEVFTRPYHPYTQHLLACAPKGEPPPVESDAATVIECEALKVHFPIKTGFFKRVTGHVKAVDGVTLALKRGETLGLVGESGSGKTTLGFALLNLLPSEGRIAFLGEPLRGLPAGTQKSLRKRMQPVFQDPYGSLNPRMTVAEIVAEGLRVHEPQLSENERNARVAEALAEVGLTAEMGERYPHEFSGGQRQRISIARAMILRPELVVLDEPTSALDLSVQSQIIELLRNLQEKHRLSYLFISHDLRVVRALAHRVLVLRHGRMVEAGETASLLSSPREEYTRELVTAAML